MIISYQRPAALGDALDPAAPAAGRSVDGTECGAVTIDTDGMEWRCTRAPHPCQDEHRAAFERDGDGPEGAVAIAWTYQYATDTQTPGKVDEAAPVHQVTVTVSFPDRAIGVDAEKIRNAVLDLFWEGDHDDVQLVASTTHDVDQARAAVAELVDLARADMRTSTTRADAGTGCSSSPPN